MCMCVFGNSTGTKIEISQGIISIINCVYAFLVVHVLKDTCRTNFEPIQFAVFAFPITFSLLMPKYSP